MISVIVPIYKVEKYLPQCIESIIAQTYKNLEIILVNDGSPDSCSDICEEYAKKDNRIKVIHKENGGLIAARKTGVRESKGEYITFVDGDDYISRFMYEEAAVKIDEYSPDMVITEFFWSYEKKDIPSERTLFKDFYNREDIENEIIPSMLFNGTYYQFGVYPNCWTKIVKREILEKNIMDVDERVRMGEDAAFTYGCIMDSKSIAVVKRPLYYYRTLNSSMSNAYDERLPDIWIIPIERIINKASVSGLNLDSQLGYYFLYLVNFCVRNEVNSEHEYSMSRLIDSVFNSGYIELLNHVDLSKLPIHIKALCFILKMKSKVLLKIYKTLLGKYLK